MVELKIQIPDGFLNEEIRCGYQVTHEMKKAWAVMLDLLVEFDRVCKKNDLHYQASVGTLLGAVRHKGFIPWDDDLDVQMFREDYDKLIEIGPKEFKHPYFLQSKYSDPGTSSFCAKLRNSETTALSPEELSSVTDYNRGIFIDIFPIDAIPDDKKERYEFFSKVVKKRKQVIKVGRTFGIFTETSQPFKRLVKKVLYKVFIFRRKLNISPFLKEFFEFDQLCKSYNMQDTQQASIVMFYPPDMNICNVNDYKETILMDFEFLKIPVTKGYDNALRVRYGEYMQYVKGPGHTGLFDTDNSYKKYFKSW